MVALWISILITILLSEIIWFCLCVFAEIYISEGQDIDWKIILLVYFFVNLLILIITGIVLLLVGLWVWW